MLTPLTFTKADVRKFWAKLAYAIRKLLFKSPRPIPNTNKRGSEMARPACRIALQIFVPSPTLPEGSLG